MPTSLTIVGNLVEEPQIKGKDGTIVELRIASTEGKDKTVYMTTKFYNNKAGEIAAKYAKKGSSVFVTGNLEEETWNDKEGQKRSKIVCVANSFSFTGGGAKKSDGEAPKKQAASSPEPDDQDVPF